MTKVMVAISIFAVFSSSAVAVDGDPNTVPSRDSSLTESVVGCLECERAQDSTSPQTEKLNLSASEAVRIYLSRMTPEERAQFYKGGYSEKATPRANVFAGAPSGVSQDIKDIRDLFKFKLQGDKDSSTSLEIKGRDKIELKYQKAL